MRKTVALIVFFAVSLPLFAQQRESVSRSSGYYFRPPRSTFHYRPDYLFQPLYGGFGCCGAYGFGYGFGRSWYPGIRSYGLFSGLGYPIDGWSSPVRRAYSTYLQSPSGELVRTNSSDLMFRVSPPHAQLYLDGKLIGTARDYRERDRLQVLDGMHELRVEYPGYRPFRADVHVEPNRTVQLEVKLDPVNH